MNSYGTFRQVATRLVAGEAPKAIPVPTKRKRTLAEFTAKTGIRTMQSDGTLYVEPANKGVNAYDALAYDHVPQGIARPVPVGKQPEKPTFRVIGQHPSTIAECMAAVNRLTPAAKPSRISNKESLLTERPAIDPRAGVKVRRVTAFQGFEYIDKSDAARREYLEANSLDNVLLPTAANDLCPKCGMTVSCKCDKFDRHGRKLV